MIIHSFVQFFLPKSLHFFINRNKQIPAFECAFIRVLFDIDNKNSFHGGRKIELSANPQNFAVFKKSTLYTTYILSMFRRACFVTFDILSFIFNYVDKNGLRKG